MRWLSVLLLSVLPPSTGEEARFEVLHFKAEIDDAPPVILERPGYLKYSVPYFKANATVRCSTPDGEGWVVGFIQQVDRLALRQEYPRAFTTWELPVLPFHDRAAVAEPPWYGTLHEIFRVSGGRSEARAVVSMDDNLTGTVTWAEPLPPDGRTGDGEPSLARVSRDQRFTTWLAARRVENGGLMVLRKVEWGIRLVLAVDPSRPVGERVTVETFRPLKPRISDGKRESIPERALRGPGANAAQGFWWNPGHTRNGGRVRLNP